MPLKLTIVLGVRNQAALEQLLADQQNPASSQYRKWLTPKEFANRFGPSDQQVDLVTRLAQGRGLRGRVGQSNRAHDRGARQRRDGRARFLDDAHGRRRVICEHDRSFDTRGIRRADRFNNGPRQHARRDARGIASSRAAGVAFEHAARARDAGAGRRCRSSPSPHAGRLPRAVRPRSDRWTWKHFTTRRLCSTRGTRYGLAGLRRGGRGLRLSARRRSRCMTAPFSTSRRRPSRMYIRTEARRASAAMRSRLCSTSSTRRRPRRALRSIRISQAISTIRFRKA